MARKTITMADMDAVFADDFVTSIASSVTRYRNGSRTDAIGCHTGKVEMAWGGRTLADVMAFASADRRIVHARSVRAKITRDANGCRWTYRVPAPGARDRVTIVTVDDVESFAMTMDDAEFAAMVERVRAARAASDTDTE